MKHTTCVCLIKYFRCQVWLQTKPFLHISCRLGLCKAWKHRFISSCLPAVSELQDPAGTSLQVREHIFPHLSLTSCACKVLQHRHGLCATAEPNIKWKQKGRWKENPRISQHPMANSRRKLQRKWYTSPLAGRWSGCGAVMRRGAGVTSRKGCLCFPSDHVLGGRNILRDILQDRKNHTDQPPVWWMLPKKNLAYFRLFLNPEAPHPKGRDKEDGGFSLPLHRDCRRVWRAKGFLRGQWYHV